MKTAAAVAALSLRALRLPTARLIRLRRWHGLQLKTNAAAVALSLRAHRLTSAWVRLLLSRNLQEDAAADSDLPPRG